MRDARVRMVSALAVLFVAGGVASAGDWSHWRGPNFDGSSDAEGLPTEFSKTEHVKWTVDMPGPAAATPIVHGDRVFISTTDPQAETLLAICIDRESGEELWRHEAAQGYQQDDRSNYASNSPVTDGERVIFFYGTGDLVAYDMEGEELWSRNLQADYGEFAFLWTFSSSPTLHDGKLYLQVLQRDEPVNGRGRAGAESYLLAMDPETGETIYRHVRPSDAVAESREAFSTPIPFEHEGREEILIAGGDDLTGHDPETGEELWRWGTWNPERIGHWRLVPSPVAGGGVVLGCAPKRGPIVAVKAGQSGQVEDSGVAWNSGTRSPLTTDVPTPLFYEGKFYVLSDMRRALSRVDPQSGEIEWTVDVESRPLLRSSPTGADGKIWYMNHVGEVFIHDMENGELINRINMGEGRDDRIRSSIAAVDDELFIRTNTKLYCIGE